MWRGMKMAVYCNQTGSLPHSRKTAVMTAGGRYQVLRVNDNGTADSAPDQVVLEGDARDMGMDEASGDHVYAADFGGIEQTGVYYVRNDAGDVSHRFRVGEDVIVSCSWI